MLFEAIIVYRITLSVVFRPQYNLLNYTVTLIKWHSPMSSGVHAFGLCATALITDILQLMTGYPTPYFLTVCKPNYTTLNISCEQNPYIMEDICSGADPAAINQGRWAGSWQLRTKERDPHWLYLCGSKFVLNKRMHLEVSGEWQQDLCKRQQ